MPSPFEKQLRQRAQRFFSGLASAGLSASLDETSFDTYSVKLTLHSPAYGRICLYYSPKRRGFTMRTHLVPSPPLASTIQDAWDHQEAHPFELSDQNHALFVQALASQNNPEPPKLAATSEGSNLPEPPKFAATSEGSNLPESPKFAATSEGSNNPEPPKLAATSEGSNNPEPPKLVAMSEGSNNPESPPSSVIERSEGVVDPKATFTPKLRELQEADIHIYVDGSHHQGRIGFGWLVLADGRLVQTGSGCVTDPDLQSQRQVSGELIATQQALFWCLGKKIRGVSIFFDYIGIEAWVTGEWKARQALTQTYRDFVRACPIEIRWRKVKSHTGDLWNERADQLAGQGLSSRRSFRLLRPDDLPSSSPSRLPSSSSEEG